MSFTCLRREVFGSLVFVILSLLLIASHVSFNVSLYISWKRAVNLEDGCNSGWFWVRILPRDMATALYQWTHTVWSSRFE